MRMVIRHQQSLPLLDPRISRQDDIRPLVPDVQTARPGIVGLPDGMCPTTEFDDLLEIPSLDVLVPARARDRERFRRASQQIGKARRLD